jgi:hypothetical protein
MNPWVIAIFVVTLYVHLFNAIANMYFDSNRSLTLGELWRKSVPPIQVTLTL